MKKRNNTVTIIVTIILIFMFIFSTIISVKYVNKITITQLGNQSHSQMMGYVIKTYNDKVIVIDASHGVLGMGDRMSISFDISNQYIIFASNERNPLYSENLFHLVEENGIVRLKYKKKGH